jgi:hypothetical protein
VSRVDDLIANYERFAKLPWVENLAPSQRVWMAVHAPEEERRVRLRLPEFGTATRRAGHDWDTIDITTSFEEWMADHEYRDAYFASPKLIQPELRGFFGQLVDQVKNELRDKTAPTNVVALIGAGSMFGLGQQVKVSALIERVESLILGRLLVFFPGAVEGNNYRLMGAQDGWNYHAAVISSEKGWSV